MTFSIIEEENKYLLNPHNLGSHRLGLYPSEASVEYDEDGHHIVEGKCLRASYYRIKGYPKDKPDSLYLIMKARAGKAMEEMTIETWKRMGILVDNNIKFFVPEFVLSGEVDAVIRDTNNKDYLTGLELKSYDGYKAEREILGSKRPPRPGQPKTNQYCQAITYAWEYKDQLNEFRLYYMDRVGGTRVEFKIGFEERDGRHICWRENIPGDYWNYTTNERIYYPFTIEDIHNRYRKLINYIKKETLPPKDYGFIDNNNVEFLYNRGDINKKDYDLWVKDPDKNKILQWGCKYCFYPGRCKQDSINETT